MAYMAPGKDFREGTVRLWTVGDVPGRGDRDSWVRVERVAFRSVLWTLRRNEHAQVSECKVAAVLVSRLSKLFLRTHRNGDCALEGSAQEAAMPERGTWPTSTTGPFARFDCWRRACRAASEGPARAGVQAGVRTCTLRSAMRSRVFAA